MEEDHSLNDPEGVTERRHYLWFLLSRPLHVTNTQTPINEMHPGRCWRMTRVVLRHTHTTLPQTADRLCITTQMICPMGLHSLSGPIILLFPAPSVSVCLSTSKCLHALGSSRYFCYFVTLSAVYVICHYSYSVK